MSGSTEDRILCYTPEYVKCHAFLETNYTQRHKSIYVLKITLSSDLSQPTEAEV